MKKTIIIVVILTIAALAIYFIQWNSTIVGIQLWDTVTISYESTLPDWRIFGKNDKETLIVGDNTIPWVDSKLIGQNSGDMITTIISATEWYGIFYDPNKVQRMPIYTLTQAGVTAEQWKFVLLWWTRYYIKNIENDIATLDTNPEHTRQDLTYSIQILWHNKK